MRLGFCGLGKMGAPMVRRLLQAGHEVVVWNRTRSRAHDMQASGAAVAGSPAELAGECDVVILCLFDWQAVDAVVFGEQGLAKGSRLTHIVDHSSLPVERTRDFADRLQRETGAAWIDAPVSGGVGGAEQGTLAIMAGGDAGHIRRVEPVLMAYAQRVTRMGGIGTGQATKLCNQTIVTTTIAAIAEAIALAHDNGVDAARLDEALAGGWADSVLLQTFVPRMTSDTTAVSATVATMLKDLTAIADLASKHDSAMPVGAATLQLYRLAASMGLGQRDVSELIQVYTGRDAKR